MIKQIISHDISLSPSLTVAKINEIISVLNSLTEEKKVEDEWPRYKDEYWFINSAGVVRWDRWMDWEMDSGRKNFLGVYRSRQEAEAALVKIKAALKGVV